MKRLALALVVVVAGGLATAAIVSAHNGPAAAPQAAPAATRVLPAKVMLRTTNLGKVLVDRQGRTLYMFANDHGGRSSCTGMCASAWPPATTVGTPVAGLGVSTRKLGTFRRSSGKRQVTYNGHPLYRYVQDKKPGDTNGQGVFGAGGYWYALKASGLKVTTGGQGGY